MKDTDIRGLLLQRYYERRREGMISLESEADFAGRITQEELLHVSSQLGEHGLIEWRAVESMVAILGGAGKITAHGIDVVEGGRQSPIAIHFTDQSVRISGSVGVAVGNSNQQTISLQLQELIEAIDKGVGSEADKREAKSRLQAFLAHPLVSALVGAAAAILPNKSS
jgi:hypothetical protein